MSHRRGLLDPTPDAPAPWTTTLAVSLVLHLACFGVALGLPRLMSRGPQGPPVYVVDLVSLPAGVPTPAAPPPGGGAPKTQPPAPPKPEKAIPDREARKPDTKKKPPEKKKEEPARKPEAKPTPTKPAPDKAAAQTPPAPESAPPDAAAPQGSRGAGPAGGPGAPGATGAPGGGAGGAGMGQADAYTFYFARLRQTIEANWAKPIYPPMETVRPVLTATVRLTLTSSGRVTSLELVAPSGYEALDASVLRAIQDAQPFPPFPSELGSGPQTVQFAFDLNK